MTVFDPIRKFVNVAVSDIVEALNTLVNEINERLGAIITGNAADVAAVAADLAAHEADVNNPHATTAHQVGTYTSGEIDGLVGRYGFQVYPPSAAITVPSGVANGANYWVQSADGNSIVSYTNNAGTPGITAGVNPLPTVLGTKAIAAEKSVESIKASIGKGATLKALFLADIGVTEFSAGIMLSWADQSGNALTAVLPSTLFSGADPRPLIGSALGAGVYFNGQTGLNVNSGLLAKTDNFALHFPFQLSVTPGQSYADVTALNAGSATQCDIAQVTGGPNTGFTPDIDYTMQGNYAEADLLKGFYQRANGGVWASLSTLFTINSPSGYYLRLQLNRFGQPVFLMNAPGGQVIVLATGKGFPYAADVLDGRVHLISIYRPKNGSLCMFLDGQEVGAESFISGGNITDLNVTYINGPSRVANAVIPVGGIRHTNWGLTAIDDCDWNTFQNSYNAVAAAVAAPAYVPPKKWHVIFITGQSLSQGSIDTSTDTWTNPNGWNGMITRQNVTRSGEHVVINRQYLKNVFANQYKTGIINPSFIGPVGLQTNASGTTSGGYGGGGGVETVYHAAAQQILANASTPKDIGLMFIHIQSAGSYTLLTQRSTPPYLVQNVKGVPVANLTQYEFLMQQMAWVHDFLAERGWEAASVDWFCQQGFAQPTGAQIITFYDQINPDIKRLFNVTIDCGFYMPQVNVANNANNNSASIAIDQSVNDALDLRGTRPIYGVSAPYPWGNHIHYYRAMYCGMGEQFGKIYARVKFQGENWQPVRPKSFTVIGNAVKIQFYLATGRQLVFKTNANNIDSILQTTGIDTYGFSYTGGGLTIASVALATTTTTNDSVLVTMSGVPGAVGHILSYIEATRFGNLFDDEVTTPFGYDQDWTVPIVAGQPTFKNGLPFDLSNPANAFKKVF